MTDGATQENTPMLPLCGKRIVLRDWQLAERRSGSMLIERRCVTSPQVMILMSIEQGSRSLFENRSPRCYVLGEGRVAPCATMTAMIPSPQDAARKARYCHAKEI